MEAEVGIRGRPQVVLESGLVKATSMRAAGIQSTVVATSGNPVLLMRLGLTSWDRQRDMKESWAGILSTLAARVPK